MGSRIVANWHADNLIPVLSAWALFWRAGLLILRGILSSQMVGIRVLMAVTMMVVLRPVRMLVRDGCLGATVGGLAGYGIATNTDHYPRHGLRRGAAADEGPAKGREHKTQGCCFTSHRRAKMPYRIAGTEDTGQVKRTIIIDGGTPAARDVFWAVSPLSLALA